MSESTIEWSGRGILLDVEGTTSAVAYVYDVMFPYARYALDDFLTERWDHPLLSAVKEQVAQDAGAESFQTWTEGQEPRVCFQNEIKRLMDSDVKATGLKQLQGLIWESGFVSGELRAHVFEDVPPALADWTAAGREIRIYSSGSIHAQKLFFGHSESGDLTPFLSGHYDTTTGPKREANSYQAIAKDWGLEPKDILFFSDVTAELDAARSAGMATLLCNRPGNAPSEPSEPAHDTLTTFADVKLV